MWYLFVYFIFLYIVFIWFNNNNEIFYGMFFIFNLIKSIKEKCLFLEIIKIFFLFCLKGYNRVCINNKCGYIEKYDG